MIRGEFWIDESGRAIFADGDAGVDVPNHAAYVRTHLAAQVINAVAALDRWRGLANILEGEDLLDAPALRGVINDWIDGAEGFTDEEKDDIFQTMSLDTQLSRQLVSLAFGHGDDEELRQCGCEELGWIRLLDANIDLHRITNNKLLLLADGLYDAHDDEARNAVYLIEDRATGKRYYDVPYAAIELGRLLDLAPFAR